MAKTLKLFLQIQSSSPLESYFPSSVTEIKSPFLFVVSVILLWALFLASFSPSHHTGMFLIHSQRFDNLSTGSSFPKSQSQKVTDYILFSKKLLQFLFLNATYLLKLTFIEVVQEFTLFPACCLASSNCLYILRDNQSDFLWNPELGTFQL